MGVNLNIISQKYYNQIYNGVGLDQDLSVYRNNLAGNVMERQRVELTIEVYWKIDFSASLTVLYNESELSLTRSYGSWDDDGFSVGDELIIFDRNPIDFNHCYYTKISSISDTIIYISYKPLFYGDNVTTLTDNTKYVDGFCAGRSWLTSLVFRFGLIENAESINYNSKVSGSEQGFYAFDIGKDDGNGNRLTTDVTGEILGKIKDFCIDDSSQFVVKYVSTADEYRQKFTISHIFEVPFYIEGELNNIQNEIAPQLIEGTKSLKYSFNVDFRTVTSDPSTSKSKFYDKTKGCVGYFGEDFNGFKSNYAVVSSSYLETSTASTANGIIRGSKTTVEIVVEKISGSFVAGDLALLKIALLPNSSNYTGTTTTYEQNFLLDYQIIEEGEVAVSGENNIITNATSEIDADKLVFTFDVEYTIQQKQLIEIGNSFCIGILVCDNSISIGNSDAVMLSVVGEFDASADIAGLIGCDKFEIFAHPSDLGDDLGFTDYIGWNEDGVVCDIDIWVDQSKDAIINTLDFAVLAINSDNEYTVLDKYSFNLSDQVISGATQYIDIDTQRSYPLESTDQFLKVKLMTDAIFASKQYYSIQIGQKITWQDWIRQLDADPVFYDLTKPNKGLNKKASNYSGINDYEIKFALMPNMQGTNEFGTSADTNYIILSNAIDVYDYDLSDETITSSLKTYHPDTLVDLDGALRSDGDTLYEVTWARTGGFTSIAGYWAIHRIQENSENGFTKYELSTIRAYPNSNLLIPLNGETQLKIELIDDTIVTSCLVSKDKISTSKNYDLSARLDSGRGQPIPFNVKLNEDGTYKVNEDGTYKIVD